MEQQINFLKVKSDNDDDGSSNQIDQVSIQVSDMFSDVPSEVLIKSRIRYGNTIDATLGIFMEYSKNSSIHGIRYLLESRRPFHEKVFWLFSFILSIYFCTHLIINTINKWKISPVIVSFDERMISINEIPFPAVTLCPEVKSTQDIFSFSSVYNQLMETKNNQSIEDEDFEMFAALMHVCDTDALDKVRKIISGRIADELGIEGRLLSASLTKNLSMPICRYNGHYYFCENIFKTITTEDGICFQFNGVGKNSLFRDPNVFPEQYGYDENELSFIKTLDGKLKISENITENNDWDREKGYPNISNPYPFRVLHTGQLKGLRVTLQAAQPNFDFICRGAVQGFRLYLQSPDEFPTSQSYFIKVPLDDEIMISISPEYITTTKRVNTFDPETRQCFFNNERYLRFFNTYNQNNCQYECLVNYTMTKCGCVKFSMPRPDGVPICGIDQINCYIGAKDEVLWLEYQENLKAMKNEFKDDSESSSRCNCLPSCVSLNYNFEISQGKYDSSKTLAAYKESNYTNEVPGYHLSRLVIFFKEKQFTGIKRSEMYGLSSFIANIGGILSLFMGISILTLIELLYFCSMRLRTNLKIRKRKHVINICEIDETKFK